MHKWQRMQELVMANSNIAVTNKLSYRKLAILRWFLANAMVFMFQASGLSICTLPQQSLPLWFASGAATAFIFMRGTGILPGIALGTYFAYGLAGANLSTALSAAAIWTMQAYLLLLFSFHYLAPTLIFRNRSTLALFIIYCCALTAVCAYLLVHVCQQNMPDLSSRNDTWLSWWLANFNGVMIFALAIYTWDYYFPQLSDLHHHDKFRIAIYAVSIITLSIFLVCAVNTVCTILLSFASLFAIAIISYQAGWCAGVGCIFIFGTMLNMGALIDAPVFTTSYATTTTLYLQAILAITAITSLIFSTSS